MRPVLFTIAVLFSTFSFSSLSETLYQITLLRAAPGNLPQLIDVVKSQKQKANGNMVIMRHSQGDHWDLMLVAPAPKGLPTPYRYETLVDFQHDSIAGSDLSWQDMQAKSNDSGLFHIEMFQAASGKHKDLLEQRRMENDYLVATKRNANTIFITRFGSDVDNFTLGFYKNFQAFAAEPDLKAEDFEKAAKDAGFAARSDIGFHLRRFLVGHQDTFASHVK